MSALFSTDQISKLSDFLDALDEWGCEDNDERAEAIAEFAVGGFDLSAYEEGRPELRVIQGGRPEPSAPSPAGVEVVACNDIPEATWKRANEIANECYALWATRSGSFAGPIAQEIATLTASLDQATRRAEEADPREAAWEETRVANANLRIENCRLRGKIERLTGAGEFIGHHPGEEIVEPVPAEVKT